MRSLTLNGIDGGNAGLAGIRSRLQKSDALFFAGLVLVCGLSAFIGIAAPLGSYGHDVLFLLDTANRVIQGQVPHRDFSSAWGPVMYLIDSAGLLMADMRPAGIGYANAVFGAIVATWTFLLARSVWNPFIASAAGIYTALLIAAPFALSNNPFDFGYAMIYNRYGYALFGIVVIECARNGLPASCAPRNSAVGPISSGIALGLLAFLKISYAMVAIPFFVVSTLIAAAPRRRRLFYALGGFSVVAAAVMGYLRFDFSDMWNDLSIAAAARRLSLQPRYAVGAIDVVQGAIIIIFCFLLYKAGSEHTLRGKIRLHAIAMALMAVAAGYLLLISNQQTDVFPLNGYAAVGLAAAYRQLSGGKPLVWRGLTPGFPIPALLLACLLPLSLWNGVSLAGAAIEHAKPQRAHVMPLESPGRGAGLVFRPVEDALATETTGAAYVRAVNDGLELLRRHTGGGDGILTLDEFNPFNYLLDRPSPSGGLAAAAYNYIFSDSAHPGDKRFFGNARYVMVRKYLGADSGMERDNVAALMRIYGPALRANFAPVEETSHWALWARK